MRVMTLNRRVKVISNHKPYIFGGFVMYSNKIHIMLLAILLASIAASAQEVNIQQLKHMTEDSLKNLTTYTYYRSAEGLLIYSNNSLRKEYDAYKTTDGKIDLLNQTGWWGSRLNDEETGEILTWEGYFVNGSEYWKEGQNWTKLIANNTSQVLQAYNELPGQVSLIRYSDMKIVGMEKIQGEDCYKFIGSPIKSIYTGMIGLQLLAAYFPSPFPLPDELKNGTFDIGNTGLMNNSRIVLTAWISRNDSILRRLDINSSLTITPKTLNISSPDFAIMSTINESTVYSNFGYPMEVMLSKEAQSQSSSRMIGTDWRWALLGSIRP
jgi:hypothetical protein